MFEAETRNVSTRGLYCVCRERLQPGDIVDCTLAVPTFQSGAPDAVMYLVFAARVLRVEPVREDEWGVGCAFDDYAVSVARSPEQFPH